MAENRNAADFKMAGVQHKTVSELIELYNRERKYQTLGMTPDMMYAISNGLKLAA